MVKSHFQAVIIPGTEKQMIPDNTPITCRRAVPGEEKNVIDLVLEVFTEFVAPLFSSEGIAEFRKFACPNALKSRLDDGGLLLVAESGSTLAGAIEIKGNTHVALLFVRPSFQGRGVARTLLQKAVDTCRKQQPDIRNITVNASPNAFSAYQKMGFNPLGKEQEANGIRFIPMTLAVENINSN